MRLPALQKLVQMELEISSDAFFSMELFSKHAREILSHYKGCSNGPSPLSLFRE